MSHKFPGRMNLSCKTLFLVIMDTWICALDNSTNALGHWPFRNHIIIYFFYCTSWRVGQLAFWGSWLTTGAPKQSIIKHKIWSLSDHLAPQAVIFSHTKWGFVSVVLVNTKPKATITFKKNGTNYKNLANIQCFVALEQFNTQKTDKHLHQQEKLASAHFCFLLKEMGLSPTNINCIMCHHSSPNHLSPPPLFKMTPSCGY